MVQNVTASPTPMLPTAHPSQLHHRDRDNLSGNIPSQPLDFSSRQVLLFKMPPSTFTIKLNDLSFSDLFVCMLSSSKPVLNFPLSMLHGGEISLFYATSTSCNLNPSLLQTMKSGLIDSALLHFNFPSVASAS